MKSPFPGMDPYLELHWRDVHHSLCTYARDALQKQIRPALFARVDERLVVESDSGQSRSIYPDVKVTESNEFVAPSGTESATAVVEPDMIVVADETSTQGFVEIIDPATGGKLVTVIEFLSPVNKAEGRGQNQYIQKQMELRDAGVSLVEIDLLYSNAWVFQALQSRVPLTHRTPYRACVKRGWQWGLYGLYRMPIQLPLPKIKIPLREHDQDAILDLQALINQTYINGAYDQIDYKMQLEIADMSPPTREWMDKLLRDAGRR